MFHGLVREWLLIGLILLPFTVYLSLSAGLALNNPLYDSLRRLTPLPVDPRIVLVTIDLCVLALFLYVLWYGLGFAESGAKRQAMIFGISLQPFYSAIPAAAALASIQTVLAMIRDSGTHLDNPPFAEAAA